MGVNYEKINSSTFRASRRSGGGNLTGEIKVFPPGKSVMNGTLGDGVTLDEFVGDSDKVRVRYSCGVLTERGSAVKRMIGAYEIFHKKMPGVEV